MTLIFSKHESLLKALKTESDLYESFLNLLFEEKELWQNLNVNLLEINLYKKEYLIKKIEKAIKKRMKIQQQFDQNWIINVKQEQLKEWINHLISEDHPSEFKQKLTENQKRFEFFAHEIQNHLKCLKKIKKNIDQSANFLKDILGSTYDDSGQSQPLNKSNWRISYKI
jgi:hypothetical protein